MRTKVKKSSKYSWIANIAIKYVINFFKKIYLLTIYFLNYF